MDKYAVKFTKYAHLVQTLLVVTQRHRRSYAALDPAFIG